MDSPNVPTITYILKMKIEKLVPIVEQKNQKNLCQVQIGWLWNFSPTVLKHTKVLKRGIG